MRTGIARCNANFFYLLRSILRTNNTKGMKQTRPIPKITTKPSTGKGSSSKNSCNKKKTNNRLA